MLNLRCSVLMVTRSEARPKLRRRCSVSRRCSSAALPAPRGAGERARLMADGESGPSIPLRAVGEPRDEPLLRVAGELLLDEPLLLGGSSTALSRLPAVWRRLRSMLSRSCRDSRLPYITSSDIGWERTPMFGLGEKNGRPGRSK